MIIKQPKLIQFAMLVFMLLMGCQTKTEHTVLSGLIYTCPMHPDIRQKAPGTCPICKMDLVPLGRQNEGNNLHLSASQIAYANIKTASFSHQSFSTGKVLNARILSNPEGSEVISSRYSGRIERLFVKDPGAGIIRGQALFTVFSEELQTLQQDYLLQLRQSAAFPDEKIYAKLAESAKNKLRLFGYGASQISSLAQTGKTSPNVTIFANASGIVREVNAAEGQYISAGSPIVSLENLNNLWVEADIYPNEMGTVKNGTPVQLHIVTDAKPRNLTINYISPQIDPISRLLKIRANVTNDGTLQPGMPATLLLQNAVISNAIALPLDAVIRDKKGAHVWIRTGEHSFRPVRVQTGEEDERQIIITEGLEDAKEVVISGAYLLYSEHVLKKGKLIL